MDAGWAHGQINEASVQKEGGARLKKGGKGLYIALGVIVLALAGTYLGLCAYAGSLGTFYPIRLSTVSPWVD